MIFTAFVDDTSDCNLTAHGSSKKLGNKNFVSRTVDTLSRTFLTSMYAWNLVYIRTPRG
jgi:hypothetical protein